MGFVEPCSIGSTLPGDQAPGTQECRRQVCPSRHLRCDGPRSSSVLLGILAAGLGTAFLGLQRGAWFVLGAVYVLLGLVYLLGKAGVLMVSLGPSLAPPRVGHSRGPVRTQHSGVRCSTARRAARRRSGGWYRRRNPGERLCLACARRPGAFSAAGFGRALRSGTTCHRPVGRPFPAASVLDWPAAADRSRPLVDLVGQITCGNADDVAPHHSAGARTDTKW